ncbi:hypothetical protein CEXT_160741 [Caerostris extrusa]|uniref:Uncharacterized protein n=1 Tax=Caerostris extrusa TaxID=172846 RepID=A0AAV4M778_CAEEX|nr:hypothetical protein CEXT_160741 [Caerostris extrusa]
MHSIVIPTQLRTFLSEINGTHYLLLRKHINKTLIHKNSSTEKKKEPYELIHCGNKRNCLTSNEIGNRRNRQRRRGEKYPPKDETERDRLQRVLLFSSDTIYAALEAICGHFSYAKEFTDLIYFSFGANEIQKRGQRFSCLLMVANSYRSV